MTFAHGDPRPPGRAPSLPCPRRGGGCHIVFVKECHLAAFEPKKAEPPSAVVEVRFAPGAGIKNAPQHDIEGRLIRRD